MSFDPNSTAQLKTLNQKLSQWLENPNFLTQKGNQRKFLKDLKNIEDAIAPIVSDLSTELDEPHDEVGFAEFLSDIGNSVVETQRKLDDQSARYLEQTKGQRHIAPTVYRLPKVAASIKFGMRKTSSKGFNIIVAKQSQEDERMLNQSLDFEIVSVPPPPGYQEGLSAEVPEVGLAFSPETRAVVFQAISQYTPRQQDQRGKLSKSKLLDAQNEVLILQLRPQREAGKDDYLLLLGDNDPANKEKVGVWYLQIDPAAPAKTVFEIILQYNASGRKGEQYELLRSIVLGYSQKQRQVL